MAIRLEDEYTDATAASADYPEGSFKNETSPGAGDGTPFEKKWPNDIIGFLQKLLDVASITPSGNPDTVLASDYYDALAAILAVAVAAHGDLTNNPHAVSKSQVGLGSVPNTDFTAAVGLNTTHRGLTNNPHGVTAAQIGVEPLYTSFAPGGDFTSGGTDPVHIVKIGRLVTMAWTKLDHSAFTFAGSAAGVIPAAYRPLTNGTVTSIYGVNGSGTTHDTIRVFDIGNFVVAHYDSNDTPSTQNFTAPGSMSWISAS